MIDNGHLLSALQRFQQRETKWNQRTLFAASACFSVGFIWMILALSAYAPLPQMTHLEFIRFAWQRATGPTLMLGISFILTAVFLCRSIQAQLTRPQDQGGTNDA